jgi:hypothetical protein
MLPNEIHIYCIYKVYYYEADRTSELTLRRFYTRFYVIAESEWHLSCSMNNRGSSSDNDGDFVFTASRSALGTTELPIQGMPGAHFLGVKRPGRENNHSPPPSADVKNGWYGIISLFSHVLMALCLIKHRICLNCTVPNETLEQLQLFNLYYSMIHCHIRLDAACHICTYFVHLVERNAW